MRFPLDTDIRNDKIPLVRRATGAPPGSAGCYRITTNDDERGEIVADDLSPKTLSMQDLENIITGENLAA